MEKDKLLKVLDMPEGRQHQEIVRLAWHYKKSSPAMADYHREAKGGYMETSLADLAFRLRDEVVASEEGSDNFLSAIIEVIKYREGAAFCPTCGREAATKASWEWGDKAGPTDWIIAALIAKEQANKTP